MIMILSTQTDVLARTFGYVESVKILAEAGFDGYLTAEVFSSTPDLEYYKKVAGGIEKLLEF